MKEAVPEAVEAQVEETDADADMGAIAEFDSVDKLQVRDDPLKVVSQVGLTSTWHLQDVGVNVSDIKKLREAGVPTVGLIGKTARKVSDSCDQRSSRLHLTVIATRKSSRSRVSGEKSRSRASLAMFHKPAGIFSEAKADKIIGLALKIAVRCVAHLQARVIHHTLSRPMMQVGS